MNEYAIGVFTSKLTTAIAVRAVQAVIDLTASLAQKASERAKHVTSTDAVALHATLEELDIEAKLCCLRAVVGAINLKRCSAPVKVSLGCLILAIASVEADFKMIHGVIEYHGERWWFNFWSSCDFSEPLALLKRHVAILAKREATLVEMLKIEFGEGPPAGQGLLVGSANVLEITEIEASLP